MAGEIKLAIILTAMMKGAEAFDKAGRGIRGMGAAISSIMPMLKMMAMYAAFNFLKESIGTFVEFEQTMHEAGSIVSWTKDQIKDAGDAIRDMTERVPQSATELGAGLYDILSAGITDTKESLEALELSAQAASAGLTQTATAAKAGISTMNAFGYQAEDLNHIFDVQFLTIRYGILRYEELAGVIGKLAPSAKNAGQSMESMFAVLAGLTKKGMTAREAATALGRAYDAMIKPTTIRKFMEMGISVIELTDKAKSLYNEYQKQEQQVKDLTDEYESISAEIKQYDSNLSGLSVEHERNSNLIEDLKRAMELAKQEFMAQDAEVRQLTMDYELAEASLKSFGEEMEGVSLKQQKHRLEIMKIRHKADAEDRELTAAEIARVEELELANDSLSIRYQELSIQQTEAKKDAEKLSKTIDKKVNEAFADEAKQISAVEKANKNLENEMRDLSFAKNEAQYQADLMTESLNAMKLASEEAKAAFDEEVKVTGEFRPLVEIVKELDENMHGLGETAKAEIIAKLFPEIRARKAIMGIMGSQKDMMKVTDEMMTQSGAMAEAYAINTDTAAADFKKFQNAVDDLKIEFGEALIPILKEFIPILKEDIIPIIRDLFIPVLQALLPAISFILDALKPLLEFLREHPEIVKMLVAGIIAWTIAQWALNVAMTANPIGLIIAAIALLVVGIITLLDHFGLLDDLVNAIGATFEWFGDAISGAFEGIKSGVQWLIDSIKWLIDNIKKVTEPLGAVGETLGGIGGGIGEAVGGFFGFQEGGIVPGTRPIAAVLHPGEGVFTPEQMAGMGGNVETHDTYNINLYFSEKITKADVPEIFDWFAEEARRRKLVGG